MLAIDVNWDKLCDMARSRRLSSIFCFFERFSSSDMIHSFRRPLSKHFFSRQYLHRLKTNEHNQFFDLIWFWFNKLFVFLMLLYNHLFPIDILIYSKFIENRIFLHVFFSLNKFIFTELSNAFRRKNALQLSQVIWSKL